MIPDAFVGRNMLKKSRLFHNATVIIYMPHEFREGLLLFFEDIGFSDVAQSVAFYLANPFSGYAVARADGFQSHSFAAVQAVAGNYHISGTLRQNSDKSLYRLLWFE